VGQGALAIEVRAGDETARRLVQALNHPRTEAAVGAERAVLRALGGDGLTPATAHAHVDGVRIEIEALVGEIDGRALLIDRERGRTDESVALASRLAARLDAAGGTRLIEAAERALRERGSGR
jgi:hydroxymethylbilane synthase